jgi:SAM-dependent methyltransferase
MRGAPIRLLAAQFVPAVSAAGTQIGHYVFMSEAAERSRYVFTQAWSGEQERLHLMEVIADDLSIEAIRAVGFSPGWRCLDVGSGSGSIARWFARETGDLTLVVATDLNTRLLAPLEQEGVDVREHDAVVDDFPDGSFDIIHARFVLEHLVRREDVLDRFMRWLAPHGALVLIDTASFSTRESSNPYYRGAMKAWVDVAALTGIDYEWAHTFPQPLQRHGYRDVGAQATLPIMQGGSPIARVMSLSLEALRHCILDAQMLSSDDIDQAQRLLADPEFWDLGPTFVATWGRRPT